MKKRVFRRHFSSRGQNQVAANMHHEALDNYVREDVDPSHMQLDQPHPMLLATNDSSSPSLRNPKQPATVKAVPQNVEQVHGIDIHKIRPVTAGKTILHDAKNLQNNLLKKQS